MKIEMTVKEWRNMSTVGSGYTYAEYFGESKEGFSLLPYDNKTDKVSCVEDGEVINLSEDTIVTFEMPAEILGNVFRYFKIYTQIENLIEKNS